MPSFENNPLCAPKYSIVRGVGALPNFFFLDLNPIIFVSPCKILEPYDNPGELAMSREREERKNALIVPPMFLPAAQGQRTHSARTNFSYMKLAVKI